MRKKIKERQQKVSNHLLRSLLGALLFIGVIGSPLIRYHAASPLVADFTFTQPTFQINEPIEVIDKSVAPAGSKIVKREWRCMIKGKNKTSYHIKSLMADAPRGQYTIYLRVKDGAGTWSSWTSQKLTITAPLPIVLTGLGGYRTRYDRGEKLDLNYTYDNPNDLEITSQRWRYRYLTTDGPWIAGRPRYFKKAGTYEVSLQVQDEWGNWSNKISSRFEVSDTLIERNGYYLFEKGTPGDLIRGYVDKDYNYFEEAKMVEKTDVAGTLLMSNSPETIGSSGLLYQDRVSGKGRLLVHHVNGTVYPKQLAVTVTNPGSTNVVLHLSHQAIKGPSRHILQLGQLAVMTYLEGNAEKTYTVAPGETICLYSSRQVGSWDKEEAISGTIDFNSSGPLIFKVAALDRASETSNITKLAPLKKDSHDRGTFHTIERQYVLDLRDTTQLTKWVIGKAEEEWLIGKDALTGEEVHNRGNYGVPITIKVLTNEPMGVVINARGGAYLGALKWHGQKAFKVPDEQVLKNQEVAALAGMLRSEGDETLSYMLPNGSSAPVLFGFIPQHTWK